MDLQSAWVVMGVSDISVGAGEGVGRMMNGAGLTSGSITRSGASGVSQKVTDVGLVRKFWVDGSEKRIWKPSLRIHLRR